MKMQLTFSTLVATLLIVAGFTVASSSANAILIGPGSGLGGATNADGGGGRINVAQGFVTLQPGNYEVTSFAYNAINTSGTVQPFLSELTNTAPRQYTPIWAGSAIAPSGTGIVTIPTAAPSTSSRS